MKKRIFMIAGIVCLAFTGCGNSDSNKDNKGVSSTEAVVATEEADDTKNEDSKEGYQVKPLAPLYTDKASDEMPDGEYSVALEKEGLQQTDNGYQLSMEFFDYDRYSVADIDSLKKGDFIQVQGQEVEVDSTECNKDKDGNVLSMSINGGIEEGGIDLLLLEDCYRTTSMDDVPLYYSIGKGTLAISKDMTLCDCIDYDTLPDGVESKYADLPESITEKAPDCWTQACTVITVKDGEIVKIVRNWRP